MIELLRRILEVAIFRCPLHRLKGDLCVLSLHGGVFINTPLARAILD